MSKKNKIIVILLSVLIFVVVFVLIQDNEQITYKVLMEDQELDQKNFIADEGKGLVGYFVIPQILVENENISIRITKITPQEDFYATLEVVVENNLDEEVFLYSKVKVDEGNAYQEKAIAHAQPKYKETVVEETYKNGEKIEEKMIPNPETYEEFYFRKREEFNESMNYKYKQIFDVEVCYADKCMEPNEINLNLQVLYSSKIESIIRTENIVELLTNDEIEARQLEPDIFSKVTSFNDVNQDVIEVGNMQYVLERNMLLLKNMETEEEEIIYEPLKRGHYILKYYVSELGIYFIEEIPGEEVENPNELKKYYRLCVMDRFGTEAETIIDDIECDWFYIPAVYVYQDILYLYDWNFLKEYKLNNYGKPFEIVPQKDSIFSNGFSDSLLMLDTETEESDFYGMPFWLKKYGYAIVSSDSGEVMIDKNGEWETLYYNEKNTGEQVGFYAINLEAVAKDYLVFRVEQEDNLENAYIYNLEDEKVEGILTLPDGSTNCQAISTDNKGIYFISRAKTATRNQQIYYYDFATKNVVKSDK